MAWFYLLIAGVLEIVWAAGLKQLQSAGSIGLGLLTGLAMLASLGFLAVAMRSLPLGTAYAVWTGIGTLGAFLIGIVLLHEPVNAMRVGAALLIVSGLMLMKFSDA